MASSSCSSYYLSGSYGNAYVAVWFYVPNEKVEGAVESAIELLGEKEQEQVSVGIQKDLLASKFRRGTTRTSSGI